VGRGSIAPAAALDAYNTTIADLLNTNRGLASGIADPQLAQQVGAFVAVSRIKELAALERELFSEVLDRGRFAPGQFRRFTSTLATRAVLLSEFRAAATDAQRAVFVDTLVGPEVQRARELQAAAVAGEAAKHLATRMRRNAENLLVLSGAEPVRRWSDPVPLARVIRAASAEIEDYNRIGVMPMADVRVVGHAVSDVVHLLAELIENAAAFSPPGTRVQVSGEPAAHGYLLEIEDQGIGMSDEELAEANGQLAKPASIDLAGAQRLGFYVVGRLAARHGIKVRLRRSWFGGVAALVLLPQPLLGGPETEMEPAAGRQGGPALSGQPPSGAEPSGAEPGAEPGGEPGAEPGKAEPVPTPVPRAFAVRFPGPGPDHGAAG
jgi:signal transduction histidine kinase